MSTDWSTRTAAIPYFEKLVRHLKQASDDDADKYEAALQALRRSQDHTAIQTKLNALAAENARLREALEWINQLEYARDTDGSLGPNPPYSWESVARLAFDYAFDALHRAVQPPEERT